MRGGRSNSTPRKREVAAARETTGTGAGTAAPGERETEATTGTSSAGEQTTSRPVFSGHAETESQDAGTQVRFRLWPAAQQSHSPKSRRSDRCTPSRTVWMRRSPQSRADRAAVSTGNRQFHSKPLPMRSMSDAMFRQQQKKRSF